MPDFRVADTAPEHRKLRAAGLAAAGLWALAGAFAMRELTDGWVPDYWVRTWPSGARQAATLVRVGLWMKEQRDGLPGFQFHDWPEYQRLAQRFAEEREQERERARRYRARMRARDEGVTTDVTRDAGPGADAGFDKVSTAQSAAPAPNRGLPDGPNPDTGSARWGETHPASPGTTSSGPHSVTRDVQRESRSANGGVTGTPSPSPLTTTPGPVDQYGSSTERANDHGAARRAAERVGPSHSVRAHRLVETYAATCHRRPPAKLRGQLAAEVDGLLEVGWPDDEITAAIDLWASKGLGPGALGSVAHELANRRPAAAPRSATDANIAALLAGSLPNRPGYPPLRAIEGA